MRDKNTLWICEHCLCAIECHEGHQAKLEHYADSENETEFKCDWCSENGFDVLYELV